MRNSAYDDQDPLTEENLGGSAAHGRHVLFVGLMTSGYSRPLGSDDFGTQLFGGYTRDRLVQRESDGVNGDILVCGGIFQERTLNFRMHEASECGSKNPGRTRTRAGKNPLVSKFRNVNQTRRGGKRLTLHLCNLWLAHDLKDGGSSE